MSHNDKIKDCDAFFEVDPITRQIKNMTPAKIVLMQGDHNSEKFTFTLPRYIEGHDMAESAKAKLHYMNPAKPDVFGMYEMADLQVDEDNAEKVKCSWLISANVTKEAGAISFLIEFECYEDDVLVYSWHTAPFTGISIGETFDFGAEIGTKYADVLEQWYNKLFGAEIDGKVYGIVASAECTISGRSIIAKFKEPLPLGQQFWYTYTVDGVDTVSGCSKGLKVSSADASKYEVTFGNKYLTDYALVGVCDAGSDTMVFTYVSENNYEAAVFTEFDIVKPIPYKYLGLNDGINLGYNNFISEGSEGTNNFGSSNIIEGKFVTAFGTGHTIKAQSATVFGQDGKIEGNLSLLGGDRGEITGRCSFGYGTDLFISGANAAGIGYGLIVSGDHQIVGGKYNVPDAEACLIIGGGTSNDQRKNTFVVKKDGRIFVEGLLLIKTTQIDKDKLDSFNSSGFDNVDSGKTATQFGAQNKNAQENVIQLGKENTTIGSRGGYIYQLGYGNKALAGQIYQIGKKLLGSVYEQILLGKFNEEVSDALLILGNGTSETDRKNAMVVKKNNDVQFSGRIETPTITLTSPSGYKFDVAINDDGTLHIT